jgi:hypothetical protein
MLNFNSVNNCTIVNKIVQSIYNKILTINNSIFNYGNVISCTIINNTIQFGSEEIINVNVDSIITSCNIINNIAENSIGRIMVLQIIIVFLIIRHCKI